MPNRFYVYTAGTSACFPGNHGEKNPYGANFLHKAINVFSALAGFKAHSQTVIIFHPSFFNAFTAFASLALLVFILCSCLQGKTNEKNQLLCINVHTGTNTWHIEAA
jgi:hypothetical protein